MPLIPTGNLPRTLHYYKGVSRLQSQAHGKVCPFFAKLTYPNETYQLDKIIVPCRMDISQVVPLDAVGVDIYFFWVPLRLIDENFVKMLGDKDPYDETVYGAPQLSFAQTSDNALTVNDNFLLDYLGWKIDTTQNLSRVGDTVNGWAVSAYWKVYNDWFRSEILDDTVDLAGLFNTGADNPVDISDDRLHCFTANKKHDYFTDAFTSAMRGDEPIVNLVGDAFPYLPGNDYARSLSIQTVDGGSGELYSVVGSDLDESYEPIKTNLSSVGITIDQITLAGSLTTQLYNKQMFGSRYTDILRGQWKVTPSDYLLGRSVYLAGTFQTLNNLPVLNTTSDDLGGMSGISATTLGGIQFTQSFEEHGILLGLSVTRIAKHIYSQGFDEALLGVENELDMYNPDFANIGFMKIKNREIYNDPSNTDNQEAFGYAQAWERERVWQSTTAGIFSPMYADMGSTGLFADFRSKWSYQDIYNRLPNLSSDWLKEDPNNIQRTLTGRLIPNAGIVAEGDKVNHSYMFKYIMDWKVTRPLPTVSLPRSLGGTL